MKKHVQPPLLTSHDGGRTLSNVEAEREWRAAWERIAAACERGLTDLHPLHPRRQDLLSLMRDARAAAGLPREPRLRSA
jgi:hypothetical protein